MRIIYPYIYQLPADISHNKHLMTLNQHSNSAVRPNSYRLRGLSAKASLLSDRESSESVAA